MNIMDVELLNAIKYTTNDGRKRTMIHFRFLDVKPSDGEKFKGFPVLDEYYDGHDVFDKIPVNYFGAKVKLTLEKKPSISDPRKEQTKVIKINDISLV